MRVLLFTGKGGVGKTTLAAASAAALAGRGSKTLVVSTDPAHSLGDAFGRPLGADPTELDTCLHGVQIDARALADSTWHTLRGRLRSALVTGAGLDALDAEELTVLPGVDELLALTEVRRLAETGPWEAVLVDCGPTAETLRLLALPEAVSGYLARMYGRASRLSSLARSITRLTGHLESLRALLTDPETTRVRLVLTPERVVVAETRRMLTSLALRGIRVDGLIANRLMPAPGLWRGAAASWLRTRRAEQDEVLAELRRAGLVDGMLRSVEHRASEPVGLPALLEIADELYGSTGPLAGAGQNLVPLLQVSEVDHGYQLRVALPLTRNAAVELARVDDDLAITVDGFRRLVALPGPLRQCRIAGAESDSQGLVVQLERT
ncbi:TRC40/GET3/ArsA family transport-energizing ATPase [Saccharomonospora sp. NPDC046836]|uniref:ArsA family ATPase n=1 Tax=Saccharomonospora sp. NPDC046836 TaxID=3156921 RepID=UPI0033C9F291